MTKRRSVRANVRARIADSRRRLLAGRDNTGFTEDEAEVIRLLNRPAPKEPLTNVYSRRLNHKGRRSQGIRDRLRRCEPAQTYANPTK